MDKILRKTSALMLIFALCIGMAVPCFAAEQAPANITIMGDFVPLGSIPSFV